MTTEGFKIGLVTGEYPPMEGGVGAFTQELAKAMNGLGHEVHVVTSILSRPEQTKRNFWQPHEPIQLGFAQIHPRVNRWRWSAVNHIKDVVLESELEVLNVQYQAAAFDMNVPAINLLPWRLRGLVTTIVTFHDLRVPYLFPKAGGLRTHAVHRLAKSADGVIVTNQEDMKELLAAGVDNRRIEQIPIGSNVKAFQVSKESVIQIRQDLTLDDSDYLLGYFGFVNTSKGPDLLLESLCQLSDDYHVVFLGATTGSSDPENNTSFLKTIRAQVAESGLEDRVHWTGYLSDRDLSTYFQACDMMVMPYRDGVSLRRGTLMAILANGRPLITTVPREPIPELSHGRNVWLTPVDDVDTLRQAIQKLSTDETQRIVLANGAQKLAKQFTWDEIARRTSGFIKRVVEQQG